MSTTEVKLASPVEIDGVTHTSIVVRRPSIADLAAINRLNSGRYLKGLKLTARVTGLSPRTLEAIERADPEASSNVAKIVREQMDSPCHG